MCGQSGFGRAYGPNVYMMNIHHSFLFHHQFHHFIHFNPLWHSIYTHS